MRVVPVLLPLLLPLSLSCAGPACEGAECDGADTDVVVTDPPEGTAETEPNDAPEAEGAATTGGLVVGTLLTGDTDCFAVEVADAGSVAAELLPVDGDCDGIVVELWSLEGARVVAALPSVNACAAIDPDIENRARYLDAGTYSVCVTSVTGEPTGWYQLAISTADSCADLPPLAPEPGQDLDADELADVCDDDDDDDGVADVDDNCPTTPNGPAAPYPWDTAANGFVPAWLILGPFTTGVTPGGCEPSADAFAAETDGEAAPELGAGDWFAHVAWPWASPVISFTGYFAVDAPREAYAFTWVYTEEARETELALGSDDGVVAWVNGEEVARDAGCRGVGTDQTLGAVTLEAGWNRLLVKVYDGGGGWGMQARFRDAEGEPELDLEVSLAGPEPFVSDQADTDGDGEGDLCDLTPAGE